MRYSARLAGILKLQVAIFPITAIHFTWPPEQPGMTSRVIKHFFNSLPYVQLDFCTCMYSSPVSRRGRNCMFYRMLTLLGTLTMYGIVTALLAGH